MFYIFLFLTVLLILIAWLGSNYLTARRKPDPAASPADYGLAFEDIEFRSGDGLTLHGWYIPQPDSNRTVIICSGANGSMDADLAVAPWLHAIGLNVLLFDWRGHGRSEGQSVTLGLNERYDLLAAVALAKSKGAQRIGVLGFSMGGTVALSTAAVCPDIDAVAVDSAFVHTTSAIAGAMQERHVPEQAAYLLAHAVL
ncbi:MAG TPA: alpha/beta fold hydrolase, partial [Anaerolineae bacterium]